MDVNVNIPNNVDDGNNNNIASKYNFLFSVGNGKFLKVFITYINNKFVPRLENRLILGMPTWQICKKCFYNRVNGPRSMKN